MNNLNILIGWSYLFRFVISFKLENGTSTNDVCYKF